MSGIELPLKIESVANKREHWAKKAHRAKIERAGVHLALKFNLRVPPSLPCVVILTRIAPRELDDDNLASGCKALRDGIADWLGIDDRDKRVQWRYAQAKGEPKQYAARVEFA